jgi:uncharacterized OB-fold protein
VKSSILMRHHTNLLFFFVEEKNLYGAKMGVGKVFFPLTNFCMRKKSANTKKNIHQESRIWYFSRKVHFLYGA